MVQLDLTSDELYLLFAKSVSRLTEYQLDKIISMAEVELRERSKIQVESKL